MKYYNNFVNTRGLRAEAIVPLLGKRDFRVRSEGVFYRNYSDDILSLKEEVKDDPVLRLTRDSIYHLLPDGLFFQEDSLQNFKKKQDYKKHYEKVVEEKEKIRLFFQPFDTTFFKISLEFGEELNNISDNETELFINRFIRQHLQNEKNWLIRKTMPILPYASYIRGNKMLLKDILEVLFTSKVDINITYENPEASNFMDIEILIHKKGLSNVEYKELDEDIKDFFLFFYEWFLPFDSNCTYWIKDKEHKFIIGTPLTLEYNTQL